MCDYGDSELSTNIKKDKTEDVSYNKKLLNLKYGNSSCNIRNSCSKLLLSYDDTDTKQVVFNNNDYKLKDIKVYRPSIYFYIF